MILQGQLIKNVGGEWAGEQMIREGKARKETVVGLSHQRLNLQVEPICFGPFYKYRKQKQDT